jgi:RHS repeat-associated protein
LARTSFGYDACGNLLHQTITAVSAFQMDEVVDANNRIHAAANCTAAYNPRLQPCRGNLNSSASVLQGCGDAVPSGNVQDFRYGYNAGAADNGNVVSMAAAGNQNFNRSYGYDPLNRLLSLGAPGDGCSGLGWSYDAWGNRLAQNNTGGTCFSLSTAALSNNRVAGYSYDAAGNLLFDGTHHYLYDAENRLISVDGNVSYAYDAEGNRVQKTVAGVITQYVYDPSGQVIHETDGNGNGAITTQYIYLGGQLLAEYKDSTTYFVEHDHLGSTRLLTRVDRSVYDSIDYLPYGEQIAGASGSTHKFTGKERDAESNLDYFGARYYSSTLGRWVSADWSAVPVPVPYADFTDPQSLNLYSYVRNLPTTRVDKDGHGCLVDGETHGAAWCFFHKLGITETQKEEADRDRAQLKKDGVVVFDKKGNRVDLNKAPDAEVIRLYARYQTHEVLNSVPVVPISPAQIANGHAYDKHKAEYGNISRAEYQKLIERTVGNPDDVKMLSNNRVAYWNEAEKTVVIHDPASPDGGTAFRPPDGKAYFDTQLK